MGPSFAERLGYPPEDRLLIVDCDELGSSHSANVATFRSIVDGVATSATLIVPCPWGAGGAIALRTRDGFFGRSRSCRRE